jgi:hypothetical protein
MLQFISCAGLAAALLLPAGAAGQPCQPQPLTSPNGPGHLVDIGCNRYEGEFRNGKLQGLGSIHFASGVKAEGEFFAGRLFGKGKVTEARGRVLEGDFVDGRLSGAGSIVWPGGQRYDGMLFENEPRGLGKFRTDDGTLYEGMFGPGSKLYGFGTIRKVDGSRLVGEFRGDTPVGRVAYIGADGSTELRTYDIRGRIKDRQAGRPASPTAAAASPVASGTPAPSAPVAAPPSPENKPDSGAGPAAGQVFDEVNRTVRGLRGLFGK